MPELPEVETIRRGLQEHLVGHKIKDVEIKLAKQFHGDKKKVINAKVVVVRRFGKGLVIDLDNDYSIAIHVKMTGQLLYRNKGWREWGTPVERLQGAKGVKPSDGGDERQDPAIDNLPDKYTHIVFHLDNDAVLYYRDVRQFGWVEVLPTIEVANHRFFKALGKEPLKDLTLKDFAILVKKYKMPIKQLLMEQSKIAGIGNIYANDALFVAKIHPKRSSLSLSDQEIKLLFNAIETVLKKGIETGGASERDYINVLGGKGSYQKHFQVYGKDGKPCVRCGTIIKRIVLGGRGTFFCPQCQPEVLK